MLDKIQSIFIFVVATIGGTTKGVLSFNDIKDSSIHSIQPNIAHYLFMLVLTTIISGIVAFLTTIACKHFYKYILTPYIQKIRNRKKS